MQDHLERSDHAAAPRPARRLRIVQPTPAPQPASRYHRIALASILLLAILIRAGIVLGSDFPLNDGGLFLQMTRDLQSAGYALPETTAYNGEAIPFAYPPLGFYAAAALDDLTPLALFDVFRLLPLAASIAVLGAFVVFARTMMPTRTHLIVAVAAFAMLPATFQWMIMGGGITRAPGFAFALLAIAQANRLYDRPTAARAFVTALLASATILSHLEMGLVVAYSSALFFVSKGRTRDGVRTTIGVGAATLLLTAPWWGTVIARHGFDPFVAAAQSGNTTPWQPLALLLRYDATLEPAFPLLAALSLVGIALMLARRQFLLPCWVALTAILDSRVFPTSASIILALLVAYAVVDVIVPLLRNAAGSRSAPGWLLPAAAVLAAMTATLSAILTTPTLLTGMTADERDAMTWVRDNTPQSSRFAIVTDDGWAIDRTSEWFPLLAGRISVATVQGQEWFEGAFEPSMDDYAALQDCATQDARCIEAWAADTGNPFDYVYIPKLAPRSEDLDARECCDALRFFLEHDSAYEKVFDGPGAIIFERK